MDKVTGNELDLESIQVIHDLNLETVQTYRLLLDAVDNLCKNSEGSIMIDDSPENKERVAIIQELGSSVARLAPEFLRYTILLDSLDKFYKND
jgi:hypothetical protein